MADERPPWQIPPSGCFPRTILLSKGSRPVGSFGVDLGALGRRRPPPPGASTSARADGPPITCLPSPQRLPGSGPTTPGVNMAIVCSGLEGRGPEPRHHPRKCLRYRDQVDSDRFGDLGVSARGSRSHRRGPAKGAAGAGTQVRLRDDRRDRRRPEGPARADPR